VGVPNKKKKAADLPLSPEGNITCVTCHIGHKQQDRFGMMLRKDNRRGGLCNSCHDDL
jgi:predicted CXXCH cytochrome family protein